MDTPHFRKRVKHFDHPSHVHALTFSCYQRYPLLNDEWHCIELAQSIERATAKVGFLLHAYVFMPEHVHLLVAPSEPEATIRRLLAAIKRPCSYRIKKHMEDTKSPWIPKLSVRERPGKMTFRFWQAGSGYDRNIVVPETLLRTIDYIQDNPVRRRLCNQAKDWDWSSWHAYHADETPNEWPKVYCFGQ